MPPEELAERVETMRQSAISSAGDTPPYAIWREEIALAFAGDLAG